jgi:DNA-binding NtrC family response regulator
MPLTAPPAPPPPPLAGPPQRPTPGSAAPPPRPTPPLAGPPPRPTPRLAAPPAARDSWPAGDPDESDDTSVYRRPADRDGVPGGVLRDGPGTRRVPGLGTCPGPENLTLRVVDEDREVPVAEEPVLVGRHPENHVVLADQGVSAFHCRVRRSGRRLLLEDRGSTNGTYLNGVRVFVGELRVGARIAVGQTVLRLCGPATASELPLGSRSAARFAIIGRDPAVLRLVERIERVAPTRATVLIVGESGSGKELVARALHAASSRPQGPFVVLNCAAITHELAETELFGHERGAFTGAVQGRKGVFEDADGGTLFLDEIGELPLAIQAKLLRALETGRVRRVGTARETPVSVRVVAATHRALREDVDAERFRLDLFHRLAQVTLEVPALRDRAQDIPLLCERFLAEVASEVGPRTLAPAALEALKQAPWPGNVRELRNAIFRAAIFGGPVLTPADLVGSTPSAAGTSEEHLTVPIDGRTFAEIEREIYERVLQHHGGNRRAAATALGLPKSTFCERVQRYRITLAP